MLPSRLHDGITRLLRWSERYTKTDMVYLASGGFWLSAAQVISSVATFFLSIAFANLLSPETNGVYRYVIAVVGLLSISTLAGINVAVTRHVAQAGDNIALGGFLTRARWGVIGGIGSIAMGGYYFLQGNETLGSAFLIAAVFIPFFDPLSVYDAFLQGKRNFKRAALYGTSAHLFATVIVGLAIVLSGDILLVIFTYFCAWSLARGTVFWLTQRAYPHTDVLDAETKRYGTHLSVMSILGTTTGYVDRFLIFHFLGAAPLAAYHFATGPVMQLRTASHGLPTLLLPKLSKRSFQEIDAILYKRLGQLFLVGGCIATVYAFAAPYIFYYLFPLYQDVVPITQVFAITIAISLPLTFMTSAFRSKPDLLREMYIGEIAGNGLLLALMFILGFFWGVWGIVLARVVTAATGIMLGVFLWKMNAGHSR